MTNWVFYFCEIAAVMQLVCKLLSWRTKKLWQRLAFGVPAFLILIIAFALIQISTGENPYVAREYFATPLRTMFFIVGLLWIFEGFVDIAHGVKIVDKL